MDFKFPNANNNHIKQNAEDPPVQIFYNCLGFLKFAARAKCLTWSKQNPRDLNFLLFFADVAYNPIIGQPV